MNELIQGHNIEGGFAMKKHDRNKIPFIPVDREFFRVSHVQDDFDPLGSYTGKVKDLAEKPVQDADDL